MFSIGCIELVDFRSYVGQHRFEFPKAPGLYFLTGHNKLNPRLGRNDCGKSTLLDAIFWCLYGRTSRGLKAGDVISWGKKSCSVTVWLEVGELKLGVWRSQAPNQLAVNDHITSQEELEKLLRLGPEAFSYAVMLPQFGDAFFDLAPAAKLTLFSDIMQLDYWLEKSQLASEQAAALLREKGEHELTLANLRGQRESSKTSILNLTARQVTFDQDVAATQSRIMGGLQRLLDEAERREAASEETTKLVKQAEVRLKKHGSQHLCPTCKQPVPDATLKVLHQNHADFERELRRLNQEQALCRQQIMAAQTSLATEANRLNPYAGLIASEQEALATIKQCINESKAAIDAINERHTATSFWVAGFKRIRLMIIEATLRQLELEVNNSLASLGLTDWSVQFDVERENKSGGVTKGFIALIRAPGAPGPTRWEAWGGGATQRLRLAGDFGLANLIMERAGLSNTIEFFDEPSSHMGQEGLLDVAETLHQRAVSSGKRILLVDHHTIDFGEFAGVITVLKDHKGSHVAMA